MANEARGVEILTILNADERRNARRIRPACTLTRKHTRVVCLQLPKQLIPGQLPHEFLLAEDPRRAEQGPLRLNAGRKCAVAAVTEIVERRFAQGAVCHSLAPFEKLPVRQNPRVAIGAGIHTHLKNAFLADKVLATWAERRKDSFFQIGRRGSTVGSTGAGRNAVCDSKTN